MPLELIVEDGTGKADANSYASLEDFAAYAEASLYADAYTAATDDQRRKALATATRLIDAAVDFDGVRVSATAALQWPRCGVRRDRGFWPANIVPDALALATCELAIFLLRGDRTADSDTAGIAEIGLGQGAIAIKFDPTDRPEIFPEVVRRYLEPLGSFRGRGGMAKLSRS